MRGWLTTSTVLFLSVVGCSFSPDVPDLRGLYDREAQYHGRDRNPIIVIPGILGSRLTNPIGGEIIWGAFTGDFADPATPEGARLTALPFREGEPLRESVDAIQSEGVLDSLKISLFGVPISAQAYRNILGTLGAGGYRDEELGMSTIDYGDEHFTCFQFPYDWRRDNVENARRLKEFIVEKKAYVEAEFEKRYGPSDRGVKFDIVAHSMGGLLTRYFLRHGDQDLPADGSLPELTWEGAEYVERAVLVGTPNAGSAEALVQLVNGIYFAPFLPEYGPGVLGTMPSIYQLLPRSRHRPIVKDARPQDAAGDLFDPAVWERFGWGLASREVDEELSWLMPDVPDARTRRRVALDHLRKCLERARHFNEVMDQPAKLPEGLTLALYAGDAVETKAVVHVTATGDLVRYDSGPGDGTVLRTSALHDERVGGVWEPTLKTPIDWSAVTFVFADHIGLTKSALFTDNVLYYLLEAPRN